MAVSKFYIFSTDSTFGKSRKFSNATFGWIKPIVLGFDPLSHLIQTNPRTIGLIRSKVALSNFHIFSTDSTFGKSRKFSNATFGRIKPSVLGFDPLSYLIRTNPRTIGLIRLKVAVSIFHTFFRPIRHSTNHENVQMPLLGELSRSSSDLIHFPMWFERIQGRSA